MVAMKEMLEAHLRRVEHDKAGFAVRLYPFTRKRELDEPRIVVIDPFISFGRPVVASASVFGVWREATFAVREGLSK